ncbi:M55 family metallopeptidase [Acetonema longum]|uniref:Peptidase M55 D-aminopeptidase n=1 Tax=Acetonema longum DSM 6540 TaxID=1009370 RepID=F7NP66_9FIRM|nr:M55 family metallopeptidase [Acetonema longum]EGO62189.1 peptidase M55 D-aminopeptidase [Acetonema longum DSM 6540]
MKVYISLDMEGIAGTVDWDQERTDRNMVRKYMTQQVEWVLEGIQESGVNLNIDEIVLADSHSKGDNVFYDIASLDDRLHLISGSPRPNYMMPTLDSACDVVFLVGYHSGIGALHGVMDHTYTSCFHKIMVNGRLMSEALLNSAYAGYHSVPVGLVVGDEALRLELMQPDAMPWARYVTTKTGLSRFAAKNRPPAALRLETIEAVRSVLESDLKTIPLYSFASPATLTIEFQTTVMADVVCLMPGIKRLDGRTVEMTQDDYKTLYNAREAIATLAVSVKGL